MLVSRLRQHIISKEGNLIFNNEISLFYIHNNCSLSIKPKYDTTLDLYVVVKLKLKNFNNEKIGSLVPRTSLLRSFVAPLVLFKGAQLLVKSTLD